MLPWSSTLHLQIESNFLHRPDSQRILQHFQIVFMIRNSFLNPIIDAAARRGEGVLSARAAQEAFERRPVRKDVFTVTPVDCGEGKTTDDGERDGSIRGVSCFPHLGQVISVRDKSTLVCHRETLSLSFLRRSFLGIGRSAWGKVRVVGTCEIF